MKYLMPKASCRETGQTVMSNDLGRRFPITERRFAQLEAERLASNMQKKTGRYWSGFVVEYTAN